MQIRSQQPLPSQLNLPRRLPASIPAFTNANGASLAQFYFVFDGWEGAGTVVGEMDAGESGGAEVVRAVCCWRWGSAKITIFGRGRIRGLQGGRGGWGGYGGGKGGKGEGEGEITGFISLLIPLRITGHVLRLLLLLVLVAALEHLFEELELGCAEGEEGGES